MNKSRFFLFLIIGFIIIAIAGIAFSRFKNKPISAPLPPALPYNAASNIQDNTVSASPAPAEKSSAQNTPPPASSNLALPAEVNLQIPFTSQAPNQNWSLPYQQFCEEASTLMAASYIKNQSISSPSDADTKLLAIKDFEVKKFGFYEDTTADETAIILKEYFGLAKVDVIPDPTVLAIKTALSQGKAAIVPLAGREIGNPYYQQPGPLYHMLVIKGYTKSGDFITNDPGTKRGADFIYKPNTIMNAIRDWNGGDVNAGKKVMIVVG